MKAHFYHALFMLFFLYSLQVTAQVTSTSYFEGGYNHNGGLKVDNSSDPVIVHAPNAVQHLFLRLNGVAGKTVLLRVSGHRIHPVDSRLLWHKERHIAVSFNINDVHGWTYIAPLSFSEEVVDILIDFPRDKDVAWVSFMGTVNNTMLKTWMNSLPLQYLSVSSIGTTRGEPGGGHNRHTLPHDLWLIKITDPSVDDEGKKDVWYIARECVAEPQSTYNAIGLVEWLLSDDPHAIAARKNAIWHVIPIANPHFVARNAGINDTGRSIKACWYRSDEELWEHHHEAVTFIRNAMFASRDAGRSVHFAIRSHAAIRHYTFFPNVNYHPEVTRIAREESEPYGLFFSLSEDIEVMSENRWTSWVNDSFELKAKVPTYLTESGTFNSVEQMENHLYMYHHDFVRNGKITGKIIARFLE
jgi:hypothetical protein